MESDLRQIFNEVLEQMRGDLSHAEINTSAGFRFVFLHNRVTSYKFSEEYKNRCSRVFDELASVADYVKNEINRDTFFPYYLAELVTVNVEPENLQFFDEIITETIDREIKKILEWVTNKNRKCKISVLLNTDFKMTGPVDGWDWVAWDRRESALAGYRSGVSDMMFFYNYPDAFWLEKVFDHLPVWSDLIEMLSVLRLSLSLSVKERIIIHQVNIRYNDWDGCPYLPTYFMKRWGHIEELRTDSEATRFFMGNFASGSGGFSFERVLDNNLFARWKSIVIDRKHRSAFHHLLNGLSDILKSHNYGNYNESFVASDGLTKAFIGLDGMLPDQTSRQANMRAFVDFWHPIFSQVVPEISKKKTKRIYSLRCALLHGDYDDFLSKCAQTYKIICPKATESNVSAQHFAFNFASFIVRTVQIIEKNPAIIHRPAPKTSVIEKILGLAKSLFRR